MIRLFTSDDGFLVQSVRSELDARAIPYMVKNEFAGGAVGELPWQEAQQELWLLDEGWADKAHRVVDALVANITKTDKPHVGEWVCASCEEDNGPAFDSCWHCGKQRP